MAANTDLSVGEKAASRGMANTMKALAFLYVVLTRDSLGAPVDVDRALTAATAPFVTKDSVYGYVLALLDGARADLRVADADSAAFPFPTPPGFSGLETPGAFKRFNRALAAKAAILRATAAACGTPCYTRAVADLDSSFLDRTATHILAFEGDSKVSWFEGNYSDYEADRKQRLGAAADQPHRIKYRQLTRA